MTSSEIKKGALFFLGMLLLFAGQAYADPFCASYFTTQNVLQCWDFENNSATGWTLNTAVVDGNSILEGVYSLKQSAGAPSNSQSPVFAGSAITFNISMNVSLVPDAGSNYKQFCLGNDLSDASCEHGMEFWIDGSDGSCNAVGGHDMCYYDNNVLTDSGYNQADVKFITVKYFDNAGALNMDLFINGIQIDTGVRPHGGAGVLGSVVRSLQTRVYTNTMYFDNIIVYNGTLYEEEPHFITVNVDFPLNGSSLNLANLSNGNLFINISKNSTSSCYINDTASFKFYSDNNATKKTVFVNSTFLANKEYTVLIHCNESAVSAGSGWNITSFLYDITSPEFFMNQSNFFNESNSSSTYLDNAVFNLSFFDDTGVFGYLINVSKDDISYFELINTSINTESAIYQRNEDISAWPEGTYDVEITYADGHTIREIGDYNIIKGLNQITFKTTEGNTISISSVGAISTLHTKAVDRYSYGFDYLLSDTERTFILESDKKIEYIRDSRYNAHFVVWNQQKREGNWIDFEGNGNSCSIRMINEKKYEIIFSGLNLGKKVVFNSIGGLNSVTYHYEWYRGVYSVNYAPIVTSSTNQMFKFNISNSTPILDISASFHYNGTQKDVTKSSYALFYNFSSEFVVPEPQALYNWTWYINVSEVGGVVYNFTVDGNQSVVLANLTIDIYDEENYTVILEDIILYLTGEQSFQISTNTGQAILENLSVGYYLLEGQGGNYPRRGVYINITNQSNSINMFLCRDLIGNDYIDYYIYNQMEESIEDAMMTFYRRYNNTYTMVAQFITDYAGQARLFQDQQNEYRITLSHQNYPIKVIDLIPLKTNYNVLIDEVVSGLYKSPYEGVYFSISPVKRTINMSMDWVNISLILYDSTSSLEYFGVYLANHSFACNPASCITNVTGSPSGGSAIVQIYANHTGIFDVKYFFKKSGFDVVYLHGDTYGIELIRSILGENMASVIERLEEGFDFGGNNAKLLRSLFAGFGVTAMVAVSAELGIVGAGMFVVILFGTAFFSLIRFIHPFVGTIVCVVSVMIYVMMSRDD